MKAKKHQLAFLLLPALLCTGCFDLGALNGSSDDDFTVYYRAFENVEAVYYDSEAEHNYAYNSYDIEESLCNDGTINSFKWEEGKEVEKKSYLYLIIEPTQALNIEQVMLYVRSETENLLQISCYFIEDPAEKPSKPMFRESPEPSETITYDDPDSSKLVCNRSVAVKENTWTGFMLDEFKHEGFGDKLLHMPAHTYLYIRVDNNSGYYKDTTTACTFSFIDLIIRAV